MTKTQKDVVQTLEIILKTYLTLDKDEVRALQFAIESIKACSAYEMIYFGKRG